MSAATTVTTCSGLKLLRQLKRKKTKAWRGRYWVTLSNKKRKSVFCVFCCCCCFFCFVFVFSLTRLHGQLLWSPLPFGGGRSQLPRIVGHDHRIDVKSVVSWLCRICRKCLRADGTSTFEKRWGCFLYRMYCHNISNGLSTQAWVAIESCHWLNAMLTLDLMLRHFYRYLCYHNRPRYRGRRFFFSSIM